MKLFEEKPLPSHEELDKEWAKLNRKYKQESLRYAQRQITEAKARKELWARQEEVEKGKTVGQECTCLPENKNCNYIDFLCSYCRWRHHQDRISSPG